MPSLIDRIRSSLTQDVAAATRLHEVASELEATAITSAILARELFETSRCRIAQMAQTEELIAALEQSTLEGVQDDTSDSPTTS